MKECYLEKWFLTGSVFYALFSSNLCVAQVVGDTTLPTEERSQVTGNPNFQIDGGARRDGNLFHSFQSFSVPTSGSAFFNNAVDVQNIFSRITGGSISNIDGVIRANGTVNLFLLNPNGILFGAGAQLNIGGSFVASTANSINFADSFQYSATNPQMTPLLTVSVPVGLQMGTNPGSIVVQGNGYDLSVQVPIFSPLTRGSNSTGLRVPVGRTLALIGGDIELIGGTLTAEQGRIELGSLRDGQVSLDGSFALSYPEVQTFGDVRLSQQALAHANGGSIQVQGNQVSLTDGSLIFIQNQEEQRGGSISVNAASSVQMSGISPDTRFNGGLVSQTTGSGTGADIAVTTQHLIIQGGASIVNSSQSPGKTGNVTVDAFDSVQVLRGSSINPLRVSSITAIAFNSGDAGDVTVSTGRLTVGELTFLGGGGGVSTNTFGTGQGGVVTINATKSVELTGRSAVFSPSNVSANAYNAGDGGDVIINTSKLVIQNGASVASSSLATGNAGSVTINATESIQVSGTELISLIPSTLISSAPILPGELQRLLRLPERPSGNSGNLTINTSRLSVTARANVGVSHEGVGNAGTVRINANSIKVDTGGSITAATTSGEGGNINLNIRDVLLLRNNSPITTFAGSIGNGGNIYIKAGSIVAFNDSDILAYAENGRGGDITLDTPAFFGENYRRAPRRTDPATLDNNNRVDVNATGAVEGVITIPDTTFIQNSLTELPENQIDTDSLLVSSCIVRRNQPTTGSFTIIGTGGLPQRPGDAQMSSYPTVDIETLPSDVTPSNRSWQKDDPIVEPQGVYRLPNGKVILSRECS